MTDEEIIAIAVKLNFAEGVWNCDLVEFARALLAASKPAAPMLKPRLLAQLRRFNECCEDPGAGGHDVDREDMHSLAEMGAVRPAPGGRHLLTDFGQYLLATPSSAPAQSAQPVGSIQRDNIHGFHMEAKVPWDSLPIGTLLYAAPQLSPTAVVLDDEQAAFEKWANGIDVRLGPYKDSGYLFLEDARAWSAWQARAAFPQPVTQPVGQTRALTCWSCNLPYSEERRREEDGHCPNCGVEIHVDDDAAQALTAARPASGEK